MFKTDSSQLELWNAANPKKLDIVTPIAAVPSSVEKGDDLGELFQPTPTPRSVLKASFATSHPLKILVADDSPINRKIIRVILNKLGYDCSEAADGKEAVAMHSNDKYDYIFMDLDMPIMSGTEAATQIRSLKNPEERQVEIIAVTANVSSESRIVCRDAGMNGFLEKPITTSIVKEQLLQSWARLRKRKAFKSRKLGL